MVRAEADFTRADGSTGKVYETVVAQDETDTVYIGDRGPADLVQHLPKLFGHGLLTDLTTAAANDHHLADVIAEQSTHFGVPSLAALKSAATPILQAWAAANTDTRELVPVKVLTDANGATHNNFQNKSRRRNPRRIVKRDRKSVGKGCKWRSASRLAATRFFVTGLLSKAPSTYKGSLAELGPFVALD